MIITNTHKKQKHNYVHASRQENFHD